MSEQKIVPPPLPPRLAKLEGQAGQHRRGKKVFVYGKYKTGKSYFIANFPGPVCAAACGEPGIMPYLRPERGDKGFEIYNQQDFEEFLDYALKNEGFFKSILIDNVNLLWGDWMDGYQEANHIDEIKAGHWRKVKGPWNKALRKLMRTRMNVGVTAWLKDIKYEGDGDKISRVFEQDNPDCEKRVPYIFDLIFKASAAVDAKLKPTGIYILEFVGGRKPISMPHALLYPGKDWKFDARKENEVSPWVKVIEPIEPYWDNGAADYFGFDAEEAEEARKDVNQVGEDAEIGRLLRLIDEVTTMEAFRKMWADEVMAELSGMSVGGQKRLMEAKDKRKAALEGGK